MDCNRRELAGFIFILFILAMATAAVADSYLPANPHQFMNEKESCPDCHKYYRGEIDPHEFVIYTPEKCWECHSLEKLGRSHPIDVNPDNSESEIDIPEELPLEDDKVSCGSCHQPHSEWLSLTKSFKRQEVYFVQKVGRRKKNYYKTYYIRMSDPEEGFAPLCLACHRDY